MFSDGKKRDDQVVKNHQRVVLSALEKGQAYLVFESGQKIKWPKDKLPANVSVGDSFYLVPTRELNTEKQKKEIAKTILEEILNEE